jgi:hypothetical protein
MATSTLRRPGLGGPGGGGVRFRCTFKNTIYDVLRARGWREVESETDWDVAWVETGWLRENFDGVHLEDHQRINHFRNHYELTRKDNLIKNLKRTQRQCVPRHRCTSASLLRAGTLDGRPG